MIYLGIAYRNNSPEFASIGYRTEVFSSQDDITYLVRRYLELEKEGTLSDVKFTIFGVKDGKSIPTN